MRSDKVAVTRFAEAGFSVVTAEVDVRVAATNAAEAAFKAGEVALLMYNAGIVRPLS